jgi:hypothetical protein
MPCRKYLEPAALYLTALLLPLGSKSRATWVPAMIIIYVFSTADYSALLAMLGLAREFAL